MEKCIIHRLDKYQPEWRTGTNITQATKDKIRKELGIEVSNRKLEKYITMARKLLNIKATHKASINRFLSHKDAPEREFYS